MKPRPLIEATFTSVARIRPDSVKNSMAPERSWLSMSVSEPSWLFGKIWISTRPLVSFLIRSTASVMRTLSGWVTGELLAYLSLNSAAPLAIQGALIVAAAAVPSRIERRVVLSMQFLRLSLRHMQAGPFARRLCRHHEQAWGGGQVPFGYQIAARRSIAKARASAYDDHSRTLGCTLPVEA